MEHLPVEILTIILLHTLNPSPRKFRRRLSLVCRTWYTVISQNPLFWTEIGLHRSAKEFREVLRRNPTGPLDVSWTPANSRTERLVNEATEKHIKTISPESRRWRSLTLAGYLPDHIRTHLIQVPNPQLIDINVCNTYSSLRSGPPQSLPLTPGGYALRNVVLGFTTLDWDSSRLKGLRNLRLHGLQNNIPTQSQLHTIISASPELEVLALTFWEWELEMSARDLPTLDLITLDSLSTLILDGIDPLLVQGVSSFIQASRCDYLKIRYVRALAVPDPIATPRLIELLRGPLQRASMLFVNYDQLDGELVIGTEQEEKELGVLDIREATSKLAARRGICFKIQCSDVVGDNGLQPWNEVLRTFARTVLQPSLSGLNIPIEFQLLELGSDPPSEGDFQEFAFENLFEIPSICSLQLNGFHGTTSILEYLASPQPSPTTEYDDGCWPCPHLKRIIICWDEENIDGLRGALAQLISIRSRDQTKVQDQGARSRQIENRHPRRMDQILIFDRWGSTAHVWEEDKGWIWMGEGARSADWRRPMASSG
ncbi:hypothetical protein FRC04_010529 [Tulasnella sp. 424]|nr:hypothetical protein FRC04_010529 [Tulasnella sp. 424]KAG8972499.1 hypothetical protein FRC05_009852 [Tulasnella sp. 425]